MKLSRLFKSVLAATALSIVATSVSAENLRLRFHTFYGSEMDEAAKRMQDSLREKSGNKIRMQYFRGGELVSSDQFVEAVGRGTIDIAYGVGSYWPGQVEIGNIEAGLPGAWTTADEAREVFKKLDPIIAEAYEEKGVVLIGRGFGSDYELLTKQPVTSLEDLKSMKIRSTGQMAKVLKEFDVPTVFLPAEELYVGLSTGVIDGVLYGGPLEYEQLKLNEVAKHYTSLNLLNPGWIETIIINQKVWNKMSDEQQALVKEAVNQYAEDIHQWLDSGNKKLMEEGELFEFASLNEEDSKQLATAAEKIWDEEAAKSERNAKAIEILRENKKLQGR
ncbi:MAG: TRAP transporter substrate-binding protein DctP [Alcaligenaceae bacterium]|jgi:TRAP-type C4-dicarboxylate transport system substrate-binding protein|nr:TRAP transporter substrate-binding protein DctP [Alcaligenaceae bacterium]